MIDFNKDVMPLKNKFYRLALRVSQDSAEAQDITQETLVRLWKRTDSLQTAAEAEALGMTICRNLSLDSLKRAGRDNERLDSQADYPAATAVADSPFESLTRQERSQMVLNKINALPARQREVLQLRDIEGYSYKEIVAALGITEEQVKVTLFRARQALKQLLMKQNDYGL
jgi:RNA polymerase sigma factor (sigma-70 family)